MKVMENEERSIITKMFSSTLRKLPGWATTSPTGQPLVAGRIQQTSSLTNTNSGEQTIHHRTSTVDKTHTDNHDNLSENTNKATPKKWKYSPPPPSPPPPSLRSKSSSLPSLSNQQKNQLSSNECSSAAKCNFSKSKSGDHAKSTSPLASADTSSRLRHNSAIKPSSFVKNQHRNNTRCMKLPSSYTMKLKERLILGFSITAVLFTLILVIDLQMDLGMSGHHLVPSHGRVKFGDGGVDGPGSAYNSFRKRFLQRSNNGSREMSSGGATTNNNNVASQQQDGGGGVFSGDGKKVSTMASQQKPVEEEPHDDFSDLLDYVINNADTVNKASEVDVVRSSAGAGRWKKKNPTLGEILNITPR
ncbi:hypothetical protein C0J52_24910 [Blattella germanica]|nr:hypothetical protein C0J52_24910 [Blattella germanica]